jgi:hypothetical protein
MSDYEVGMVCYTEGCPNERGNAFNVIEFDNESELDMFMEAFGHGSETQNDYCPLCGVLGVAEC